MKIRDLLVIAFTAIVALLLFVRSALADGSCPGDGAGGSCGGDGTSCQEGSSGTGAGPDTPILTTDWLCSEVCAATCAASCQSTCDGARDVSCALGCYPLCAETCYLECAGSPPDEAEPEPEPVPAPTPIPAKLARAFDPDRRRPGSEGRSFAPAGEASDSVTHGQGAGCSASPGPAAATLFNSLAALAAVGLVARRRRR